MALLTLAVPLEKPAPPPDSSMFGPEFFIALAIFLLASIFLIQKPKQKREAAKKKALEDLMKKGNRVVSIGGIHGTVARVNKQRDTVFVTVAKGFEMEFNRGALNMAPEEEKQEDEEKEEKGKQKAKK